ncbi:MAG: phosphorylase [Bacteroidetes bacterium]|nr:MAG: phosphorylase [Bacteroidota bacterium]
MPRALAPSELVIRADGSIYHLNLQPEDIADTIITVGDPERVKQVSKHFDRIDLRKQKREFVTHTGYLGPKRLTVISTGIGPDNIDIVLNELDALANIDFATRHIKAVHRQLSLIRLGTSGCLQPDIDVEQLVFSSYGLGLDNLLYFYGYHAAEQVHSLQEALSAHLSQMGYPLPVHPYLVGGSSLLLDALAHNDKRGITVTAPGFYAPQGRQLRLNSLMSAETLDALASFSHAKARITNFEMETSALYGLSQLMGHQALSCSVILANRSQGTFSTDPGAAVEKMIVKMLSRISEIG